MRKLGLAVLIGLVGLLGDVPIASAVATYGYEGNNFANIANEDPPAGTYDIAMRVTGSVTFANELAPNQTFGDVTGDVVSFVLDDGRLTITSSDATGFSFVVSTDAAGMIESWSIFAEAQQSLGAQLLETHQIVSRTPVGGLDRGILFVDEMGSRLGTDNGLNGNPGSWGLLPNFLLVVLERADGVFTPGAEFLLDVEVVLSDPAAVDLTSVTVAFPGFLPGLSAGQAVSGTGIRDDRAVHGSGALGRSRLRCRSGNPCVAGAPAPEPGASRQLPPTSSRSSSARHCQPRHRAKVGDGGNGNRSRVEALSL